jgi:hypothetical protein
VAYCQIRGEGTQELEVLYSGRSAEQGTKQNVSVNVPYLFSSQIILMLKKESAIYSRYSTRCNLKICFFYALIMFSWLKTRGGFRENESN